MVSSGNTVLFSKERGLWWFKMKPNCLLMVPVNGTVEIFFTGNKPIKFLTNHSTILDIRFLVSVQSDCNQFWPTIVHIIWTILVKKTVHYSFSPLDLFENFVCALKTLPFHSQFLKIFGSRWPSGSLGKVPAWNFQASGFPVQPISVTWVLGTESDKKYWTTFLIRPADEIRRWVICRWR